MVNIKHRKWLPQPKTKRDKTKSWAYFFPCCISKSISTCHNRWPFIVMHRVAADTERKSMEAFFKWIFLVAIGVFRSKFIEIITAPRAKCRSPHTTDKNTLLLRDKQALNCTRKYWIWSDLLYTYNQLQSYQSSYHPGYLQHFCWHLSPIHGVPNWPQQCQSRIPSRHEVLASNEWHNALK